MSQQVWTAAFERYAIGAQVIGEWNWVSAKCHLDICLRIAESAKAKGKKPALGMVYDEVARRQWAELARSNCGFDINRACLKIDEDLLSRANDVLEVRTKKAQESRAVNNSGVSSNGYQSSYSKKYYGGAASYDQKHSYDNKQWSGSYHNSYSKGWSWSNPDSDSGEQDHGAKRPRK